MPYREFNCSVSGNHLALEVLRDRQEYLIFYHDRFMLHREHPRPFVLFRFPNQFFKLNVIVDYGRTLT